MIRKIDFENFMSLRRASVELAPLTVFIGENGVGKSAIFKGLVVLSRLTTAPVRGPQGDFAFEQAVGLDDLVWNGNAGLPIRFRVWIEQNRDEPDYTLELRKGPEGWSVTHERILIGDEQIEVGPADRAFEFPTERRGIVTLMPPLRASLRYLVRPYRNDSEARSRIEPILRFSETLGMTWRYRPSADDIASFVAYPGAEDERQSYVAANGYGVARELQSLQGTNREVFGKIEESICRLFPHIRSLGFETHRKGVRLAYMTNRSGQLIRAPQESDGVLLGTFLFWRLYSAEPTMKICLEEPENGLHPLLLAERFSFLKKFVNPEGGYPQPQLLISTHSPEFLRAVKAHPQALWNELRIVEFNQEQGTIVRGLTGYREAATLIEGYLNAVHERWGPLVREWE